MRKDHIQLVTMVKNNYLEMIKRDTNSENVKKT